MKILNENIGKNIIKKLNESKVYRDNENPSDYIVLSDSGELEQTSAGDIINFGKVCGFNKVKDTTYLVVKDDDSKIYLYSVNTGFPFTFSLASESKGLHEGYSDRLGGEPTDFINDLEMLRQHLETFDMSKFGTHLAAQMITDFVETINSQIEMTKNKYDL